MRLIYSLLVIILPIISYGQGLNFIGTITNKSIASSSHFDLTSMTSDATGEIQLSDSTFNITLYDSAIYDFSYKLSSYNVDSLNNGTQVIEFTGIEQCEMKFKFNCRLLINKNTWEIWFHYRYSYWYFAGKESINY